MIDRRALLIGIAAAAGSAALPALASENVHPHDALKQFWIDSLSCGICASEFELRIARIIMHCDAEKRFGSLPAVFAYEGKRVALERFELQRRYGMTIIQAVVSIDGIENRVPRGYFHHAN